MTYPVRTRSYRKALPDPVCGVCERPITQGQPQVAYARIDPAHPRRKAVTRVRHSDCPEKRRLLWVRFRDETGVRYMLPFRYQAERWRFLAAKAERDHGKGRSTP